MLKHIIYKSTLALVLSLAVAGTAGAGGDYSKKDNDKKLEQDKKDHDNKKQDDKKMDDKKKHEQDKKVHDIKKQDDRKKDDKKKHDDFVDNDYDPSYDDPRMDGVKFDCAKSKNFPADNEKLCEKFGGEFLQFGKIKKCVIDKDPYRATCKLPKKYPFEADITAATKVFIRVGDICVTKKLPGEIVACFNSHGKPVRKSLCEDKGCLPDEDRDKKEDRDYGKDDYGRERERMVKY